VEREGGGGGEVMMGRGIGRPLRRTVALFS